MARKKTVFKDKTFSLEAQNFYSDYTADDILYGKLIRSPASTGRVSDITIPDLPEGYFLFTGADIPGQNKVTVNEDQVQIFTQGNVSYKGEVLGILAGPDYEKVQELAENAEVSFDIDSLESAFKSIEKKYKKPSVDISTRKTARSVSDFSSFLEELNEMPSLDTVQSTRKAQKNIDGKTIADRTVRQGLYKSTSVENAHKILFTENEDENIRIFTGTWNLTQVDSLWQETNGAFCQMENDILHVCTPTKWSYLLQDIIVQALNLSEEKIVIHKTKTSGMYSNGIWKNAILATQVAAASFLTGKAVKLVLTQKEQDLYMKPGFATEYTYETAVTNEGIIKAMHIEIEMDAGFTNPYAQEIIDRLTIACTGIYKPENLYISAKATTSSNPPTSIYPRIIDSQSFFALESHMQDISKALLLSPDELRLKNLIPQATKSTQAVKETKHFISLPLKNIDETFIPSIQNSDFERKYFTYSVNAEKRMNRTQGTFFALPLRGIGFSCAYDGSGFFGKTIYSCDQKMEVTFNSPSDIEIHFFKPSNVVETIWKEICAKILDVEPSAVHINSVFPAKDIPNIPEETSSNISVMTYLLEKCCEDIQKKRFKQPLPLSSKKQLPPSIKNRWNDSTFSGIPFHATSFGSVVIELILDPQTYMEKIKGIWMTVNCGKLFDKKAAEKSLKLAIQQELNTLVSNSKVHCDSINISFIESQDLPGQIGELVHNTIPAAFASALSLALSSQISSLPVSQDYIYELIKQREIKKQEPENNESENPEENENENIIDA